MQLLIAEVELQLLEGSLDYERRDGMQHGIQPGSRQSRSHAHKCLLKNAGVIVAVWMRLGERLKDAMRDIPDHHHELVILVANGKHGIGKLLPDALHRYSLIGSTTITGPSYLKAHS